MATKAGRITCDASVAVPTVAVGRALRLLCTFTTVRTGVFGSSGSCNIQTRNAAASPANKYNGLWLTIRIDLPVDYSCSSCWWKVRYTFSSGSQPTDRTTWRANILGDPVHLVE